MIWQDYVVAITTILFGYALIPQVYYGFKKKKTTITIQTSTITFLGLYTLAVTFLTLGLYFSTFANLITGTLWAILLIQKLIYR